MGFLDFAGAGAVHLLGGTAAFWGAKILGQRYGIKREHITKGEEIEGYEKLLKDYPVA